MEIEWSHNPINVLSIKSDRIEINYEKKTIGIRCAAAKDFVRQSEWIEKRFTIHVVLIVLTWESTPGRSFYASGKFSWIQKLTLIRMLCLTIYLMYNEMSYWIYRVALKIKAFLVSDFSCNQQTTYHHECYLFCK